MIAFEASSAYWDRTAGVTSPEHGRHIQPSMLDLINSNRELLYVYSVSVVLTLVGPLSTYIDKTALGKPGESKLDISLVKETYKRVQCLNSSQKDTHHFVVGS